MELSEIVNIGELRGLCESFTSLSGAVTAILDLEGNILIATGWQDICTCFHRVHPESAKRCLESDTILAGQLRQGKQYNVYKCKNGLVDAAVPIIIEGEHIANFFTGQFFFDAPDKEYFKCQAEEFGFDTVAYIEALNRVPIFSYVQVRAFMEFFTRLTQMVAKLGLAQKRQNEIFSRLQESQEALHEKTLLLEQEISERQWAQEELARKHRQLEDLNRTLEQRVDASVTELRTKDQLMIQQSRQAVMGEMINNIAHQWKQPLNNLALTIQAMACDYEAGQATPEEMKAENNRCLDLIMFMSQTIDDFQNFFRADRHKTVYGIRQSISHAIRLISASLKDNGIKIVVEPGDEIQVIGYPNEYSQVLLNLMGNARDVFIERSVAAPLIAVRVLGEEGRAVVTVSDNGGGISNEVIRQIFNPYFTTKERDKGTGIGLFMSKNIIEHQMGGSLTVENIEGGAQFRIDIPKGNVDSLD
jgi:C4-dicarboxylate-specific signal transduction histidine kinase